jgi:hypothetical protein
MKGCQVYIIKRLYPTGTLANASFFAAINSGFGLLLHVIIQRTDMPVFYNSTCRGTGLISMKRVFKRIKQIGYNAMTQYGLTADIY